MNKRKTKAIFFIALFFAFFALLKPKQTSAEEMCCPPSYNSASCKGSTDKSKYCCRWAFLNYSEREMISCTELIAEPFDQAKLRELNPLSFLGANADLHTDGNLSIAGLINRALTIIFPLAGLALFLMLVIGGFQMLTGAASKQNLDSGKQRVTAAIIGFLLLFSSYWIVQIVEQITGVGILG